MGFFTKLEKLSEKYIEGFFKTKFADHIQPAEIAKLLLREMRDNKNVSVSKVYVPNEYSVFLSESDWQTMDAIRYSLSVELQEFIKQKALDKGYEMIGPVKVVFELGDDLPLGTVYVKTFFSEEPPAAEESPGDKETEEIRAGKPSEYTIVADKGVFYNQAGGSAHQDTLIRMKAAEISSGAFLVQKEGTGEGMRFKLGSRGVIIGRRRTSDICLEDTNVSRVHASIDCLEACYFITDLGSTNGTFVNGIRINKKKLVEGDNIRIGTTILEFRAV